MIAIRTRRAARSVAVIVAFWLAVVAALAVIFPGEHRSTMGAFTYWLWALPLGLVIWFLAEAAGTWLLSRPFIERLSSTAQVFIVVLAICACIVIAIAARYLWNAYAL